MKNSEEKEEEGGLTNINFPQYSKYTFHVILQQIDSAF